jgi:AcrR family transcriptional regulator
VDDKHHRAKPMAPEERRRSIIEAVVPLLVEHGATVTTRQMAAAAGVAEGTIFSVFDDKTDLLCEAVRFSMDPQTTQRQLSQIYPEAPLEVQLAEAARILLDRFTEVVAMMPILRSIPDADLTGDLPGTVNEANAAIHRSLIELFERQADRLRIDSARAASALRGLIFAAGYRMIPEQDRMSIQEIVGVLLQGIVEPVRELAH